MSDARENSPDADESRVEQVTEIDITPLSICLLHELPQAQSDLGWTPNWITDFELNPRYARWDRLPRLKPDSTSSRHERERDRTRESSEESPVRAPPLMPRQTARRGRPAAVSQKQPEPRPRKKPRTAPQMPPPSSNSSDLEPDDMPRVPIPVPRQNARPPASLTLSAKQRLEQEWNEACKIVHAAYVVIGDREDDAIPQLDDDFKWVEAEYELGNNVLPVDEGFLISCTCGNICEDAHTCECQEELPLEEDEDGQLLRTFAYDKNGLFKFDRPMGTIVIECNKNCSCGLNQCINRVAQRPRDVALKIFKTDSCGWGVKASKDLPKGKVLGLFTGVLITRREAVEITGENKSYIFDLDALEEGEDITEDKKYSVDAYKRGNWTRFVNHSCEPNLEVSPVVWDAPASMNRPYLAFVTKQEIPEGKELTVDYDPKAARDKKGKKRQQPGAKECRCGTASCRGWVAV